MADQKMRLT